MSHVYMFTKHILSFTSIGVSSLCVCIWIVERKVTRKNEYRNNERKEPLSIIMTQKKKNKVD